MPLISLWESNAAAVSKLSIEQIVAAAGDGGLKDKSACSSELREFLNRVSSPQIGGYVEYCLANSFAKGGMVLQDLVNELGRRLGYHVINGRYSGVAREPGYDGLWIESNGHDLVAEVKTSDAYRISLDTLASYRTELWKRKEIARGASILIVVGRQDTGELEAQIRGSRHAWDMRLISADALLKLVHLVERAEGPRIAQVVHSLLRPFDYTRLDPMIDIMLTAAEGPAPTPPMRQGEDELPA